jgi:integrase
MASELLDGNTLRKVRNQLKKGETGIWRDTAAPGLAIRVFASKASWAIVTRDGKHKIADLGAFSDSDIPALRDLTVRARAYIKEGHSPDPLIAAFLRSKNKSVIEAGHDADVELGIGDTWEQVRDAFLAAAIDPEDADVQIAKDTLRGYRSALGAVPGGAMEVDFEPIRGKNIAAITTRDLAAVTRNIRNRGKGHPGGKVRQANLTASALKACFEWYVNTEDSLIENSPAQALKKTKALRESSEIASPDAERTFNEDEIGLFLLGLDREPNFSKRLALQLQLFTGQRRLTPLVARKDSFVVHPYYGMTWRLSGDKAKAWRVLPLPQQARIAVESALALGRENNPYLFPQQRRRRAGDGMDGHLSERSVSETLEKMREPGGTLHGLPFDPGTHDLRRSFVTIMAPRISNHTVSDRRLMPEDIEMITHANEGRRSTASSVYDRSEYLDVKFAILEEWESICMAAYERAKANARDALQAAAA